MPHKGFGGVGWGGKLVFSLLMYDMIGVWAMVVFLLGAWEKGEYNRVFGMVPCI